MTDCLFCRIVAGQAPADVVHRDARTVAFRDINPQAATHILVVPVEHYPDAGSVAVADPALVGEIVAVARALAASEGADTAGYRMVFNTGPGAGQTVFHAHLHLLGGRRFGWPPG